MHQKVRLSDAHEPTPIIQTGAGYEAMNVWMKPKLLVPCVEHRREAADAGSQALGGRELLGEGSRGSREEQVVGFLREGAEEAGP